MDAPDDDKAAPPPAEQYGTEVLCASWNPAASAVAGERVHVARETIPDPSTEDLESFLTQFYRLQGS